MPNHERPIFIVTLEPYHDNSSVHFCTDDFDQAVGVYRNLAEAHKPDDPQGGVPGLYAATLGEERPELLLGPHAPPRYDSLDELLAAQEGPSSG